MPFESLVKKDLLKSILFLSGTILLGDNFAMLITPLKITFPINKRSEGTLFVTAKNSSVALEIMHKNLIIISKIKLLFRI
jgi:hypothetical protein